jgi:hypothetical protein
VAVHEDFACPGGLCRAHVRFLLVLALLTNVALGFCSSATSKTADTVSYRVSGGQVLIEAEGFAQALGATTRWDPQHTTIAFLKEGKTLSFAAGVYFYSDGPAWRLLEAPPYQDEQALYVPAAPLNQAFGGSLARNSGGWTLNCPDGIVRKLSLKSVSREPKDHFERVLWRLDRSAWLFEQYAPNARRGELNKQVQQVVVGQIKPGLPVLQKISESKLLGLVGYIPGLGKPVAVMKLACGASVEIVKLQQWCDQTDTDLAQPLRKAVIACDNLRNSQDRSDLPALVSSMAGLQKALRKHESLQTKLIGKLDLIAGLVRKFTNAGKTNASVRAAGSTLTSLSESYHSIRNMVVGLNRQTKDGIVAAAGLERDGRAAMAK